MLSRSSASLLSHAVAGPSSIRISLSRGFTATRHCPSPSPSQIQSQYGSQRQCQRRSQSQSQSQSQRQRTFTSTAYRSARTHGSLSHYDALKLSKNATKQQIKAKFYELSKLYHPDAKGGDTAKFHEINDAYAVLGDDSKRRQYDISITPASQSHHHAHSPRYGYGPGSHSSFTPHDPYLHRAAQGPHRAWSASSASHRERASQGHAPRTEHYSPFGRRTPPNFQYTYEYNFQYNPNARRATGAGSAGRRKTGNEDEDEEHGAAGTGGGGMWKFVVTVGLILVVISLGGGLTANSQNQVDWEDIIEEQRGQGVAWEGDESDRSPQHGDVDTAPEVPSVPGRIGSGIPSQRRIETRRRTERSNESMQLQETDLS